MLNHLSFEGYSEKIGNQKRIQLVVYSMRLRMNNLLRSPWFMVAKETNLSMPTFVWYWLKTTMKSTLFLLLFFGSIHCNVENKISKVICSLCPSKDVDFLKGSLANPVKLSKDLFKECNIRFRILTSDASDFGKKNLVSFASLDNQNKETLWPFQTIFS